MLLLHANLPPILQRHISTVGLLQTNISYCPNTVIMFCPETPQGSVMWLVLSYHAVVYLVLSDHCLPDPERWRPCNNCCFTWQAFGQLPKALRGMSFYHPYGAAAREERADFRHVKTISSTQQTAMVLKRIYNLLPGSCSLRGNRPCGGVVDPVPKRDIYSIIIFLLFRP